MSEGRERRPSSSDEHSHFEICAELFGPEWTIETVYGLATALSRSLRFLCTRVEQMQAMPEHRCPHLEELAERCTETIGMLNEAERLGIVQP